MVTPCVPRGKLKYSGDACLRFGRCRPRCPSICGPAPVPCSRRRRGSGLDPNSHRSALRLIDLERIGLAHEVAQLAEAERPGIEIGSQIGKLAADLPEGHP